MKTLFKFAAMFFLLTAFAFSNLNAQITLSGSTGGLADGTYATFSGAGIGPDIGGGVFATLNNAGFAQAGSIILISVTGNTAETGANGLNAGGWTSISVTPSGGAAWTITGSMSGNALILLNGADNVTFDGLNTGGNSLTIENTNSGTTSGTSTIRFITGASNNVVTNCTILGSFSGSTGTNGGNIFFSTDAAGGSGNDNNTISNCDIGPSGGNTPSKLIYGNGSNTTAAIRNSGNIIDNNNLFDCFRPTLSSSSIHILSGNDLWTINNNRIYQTAPRVFTVTNLQFSAIFINHTTAPIGSHTITNNIIGYGSSTQTGTTTISGLGNFVRPIWLVSTSITDVSSIQGNTISGMNVTSSNVGGLFIGISMGVGGAGNGLVNVTGNTIGSLSPIPGNSTIVVNSSTIASAFAVTGIYNFSLQSSNTSNNRIGNITINQDGGVGSTMGFRGVLINTTATASSIISENEIAMITNNHVGNNATYGIVSVPSAATILSNVVRDMSSNGNGLNIVHNAGILCQSGLLTINNIEKNNVHNLTNTGDIAGAVWGIFCTFPVTANEIKQNYVYALDAITTSPAYSLVGISNQGVGTATVYNNMITLGLNSAGLSITSPVLIRGIDDLVTVGPNNYYYNTVYITGSGVDAGLANTFAMFSTNLSTREFKNNIFWNGRSNAVGGGTSHYAITVAGALPNPLGLTSDYNDLYVSGTDGVVGRYNLIDQLTLLDWQTATGQDANSSSVPVSFIDPANGNLHLDGSSVGDEDLIGTPIPGIDTDIDKQLRDPNFPYMGADEGSEPLPVELASFTSTVNGRDVNLIWATTTELNNAGFDIERSVVNGTWSKIGNVAGNGTTTTAQSYSYTDRNVASGNYSYRLKQIDFNGNFEYFNLSNEVGVGVPTRFDLSQNYPNPFNPSTSINFDLPVDGKVSLKIYDMTGKEVMTLVNEVRTAGYYSVNFNGFNLASGAYFYRISAGDFNATKKMTLIK